jgi:hypothetical protein
MDKNVDEIKNAGTQALLSIINGVSEAASFLKGEIPLAVQELLTYYTISAFVLTSVWLLVAVGLIVGWFKVILKYGRKTPGKYGSANHMDEPGFVIPTLLGSIAVVISSFAFLESLLEFIKITVAPRIWLLEYAGTLVK